MGITKEAYLDLQEKYDRVTKLVEEESKLDPKSEPYLSRYAAKQLLITMKASIETLLYEMKTDNKDYLKLKAMLGAVWMHLGVVSVETEELSNGEKQLNTCLNVIDEFSLKPEFVLICLNTLNQLGILWSERDNPQQSKEYLTKAERLYSEFKELNVDPVSIPDLFKINNERNDEEANKNLEKTHTLTLYYLAQIYGTLKDSLKSAVYCHVTLKRQLETDDYDPVEWALNAATLSQYFMEQNGFKQARHHLAAASYILDKYEGILTQQLEQSEEYEAKMETFQHRSADIARCWAKYGILLLSTSRDRLLNLDDEREEAVNEFLSSDLSQLNLSPNSTVSVQDLSDLHFPSISVHIYENEITDQFVLAYEDARSVFLNVQSWLNKALEYYTLESHASDYVQIVQDVSQMYKYLAFFEEDPERQCKMHKRRIDRLEDTVMHLNPNYYIQACRQMWYELAETYYTILDIKLDKLKSEEHPSPHALQKVNHLIDKSISHYHNFLNSLKDPVTKEMPEKLHEDLEKPALKAYFHIGFLYGKYITPVKVNQLENTKKSFEYYKKLVDYCDKHKSAEDHVRVELSSCREVIALLPVRIMKLTNDLNQINA